MSYGIFFPDCGTCDQANCDLCGSPMNVKRNCYGPTSWAAAMGGLKRQHDTFTCPFRDEVWHVQAGELTDEMRNTRSQKLRAILQSEIDEILRDRKPTL